MARRNMAVECRLHGRGHLCGAPPERKIMHISLHPIDASIEHVLGRCVTHCARSLQGGQRHRTRT